MTYKITFLSVLKLKDNKNTVWFDSLLLNKFVIYINATVLLP